MAEFLGTIRSISAGRRTLDLFVFDDGIIVGRGDLKGMALRMAGGVAAGRTGLRIADELASRRELTRDAAAATTSREDLLAAHADNRWVSFADLGRIHVSHPRFPPVYRLDLERIDGARERFEWKRLANDPGDVVALLRRAVGDRLTTERI